MQQPSGRETLNTHNKAHKKVKGYKLKMKKTLFKKKENFNNKEIICKLKRYILIFLKSYIRKVTQYIKV